MMMGGFGALKAMNDTIKLNREMLKAGKRQPFQKEFKKKSDGSLVMNEKTADESVIKLIRASALEDRKRSAQVSIFLLVFLTVLLTSIAVVILQT